MKNNLIQIVVTFHGGMVAIGYEWGKYWQHVYSFLSKNFIWILVFFILFLFIMSLFHSISFLSTVLGCLFLFPSLSLSLFSLSLSYTLYVSLSCSLCFSICPFSVSQTFSLSLSHTHIHCKSLSRTHCISLSHIHTLYLSLSYIHTLYLSLFLTHCIYLSLSHFLSLSLPRPGSANHLAPNDSSPDDIADLELGRQMVTFSGTFQKEILYPGMLLKKGIRWNIKFNSSNFLNTNNYRYLITIFVIFHIQWVVSTV